MCIVPHSSSSHYGNYIELLKLKGKYSPLYLFRAHGFNKNLDIKRIVSGMNFTRYNSNELHQVQFYLKYKFSQITLKHTIKSTLHNIYPTINDYYWFFWEFHLFGLFSRYILSVASIFNV